MGRNYEHWIKAYVNHTRASESPDNFHFWTAVGTVAGALRRRVWIDQRIFQWTPNFYIILVGPPGVAAKSTSIRQGLSILEKVPGVHFGPQSMTWQALATAMEQATEGIEINDETHIQSCLTISISELGTFLRADDDELMSTLIAMWDGQKEAWRRSTKTQGDTVVQNPWINLIGCTTPAWIRANIPNSMVGGGLTSRIVFVYGEKKRQLVAYPGMSVTSKEFEHEAQLLAEDLQQIGELKGEYELTPDAIVWGQEWYEKLNTYRPEHLASERFDGYVARKQTHLHKLAMVLAASQRDDLVITRDDLQMGELLIREVENDMIKVFHSIGVAPGAAMSQEILKLIQNSKAMDYSSLWRECMATMPFKEFKEAFVGLVEAGQIQLVVSGKQRLVKSLATLPDADL